MRNHVQYLLLAIITTFSMSSCEFLQDLATNNDTSTTKPKEADAETRLRQNITESSREHIGTKYKYAGKKPSTGFDCSGFTSYVYGQYSQELSSSSSAQSKQGKKIALKDAKSGDLIFFSRDGKTIMHVALVLSNTNEGITVIHSTSSKGVIIQNITKSNYWKPKILFARDVLSDE